MNAVPSAGGFVLAFNLALATVFPVTTLVPYKNLFALAAAVLTPWAFGNFPHLCVCT